jgi:hypothetical protein
MPLIPIIGQVRHIDQPLLLMPLLTESHTPDELFTAALIGWDTLHRPVLSHFLQTGLIEIARWYAVVTTVFAQCGERPLPLKIEWEDFAFLQAADVQRLGWSQEAMIGLDPEPPSAWHTAQARQGVWGMLGYLLARLTGRVMPTEGQTIRLHAVATFEPEAILREFVAAAQLMAKRLPHTHRQRSD